MLCFIPPMRNIATLLVLLLACATAPVASASGKKEQKTSITFHMQGDESDNPKMIVPQMVNGKKLFFRRVPEISTKDIVSFAPFPAADGEYGIVIRLKESAANRISAVSTANQGRWLLALVSGRVCDAVLIDKPVSDARLVIWKRITAEDIALFDQTIPRIGKENEKKKKSWFSSKTSTTTSSN